MKKLKFILCSVSVLILHFLPIYGTIEYELNLAAGTLSFETGLTDTCDASFTILNQPVITIISPNGGETWPLNKIRIITWNISDVTSTLNITLWKDGEEIGPIAEDLPPTLTSFAWTVGNYKGGTAKQGTDYTIKITNQENSVDDTSDDSFTITDQPTIRIISPNGGETWPPNKIRNITWNISNLTSTLNINLLKDGESLGLIAEDIPFTSTSFAWTVGNFEGGTAEQGTGYTINITDQVNSVSDNSDDSFTISDQPAIWIISPNGGETWPLNKIRNITWNISKLTSTLNINLWKDGVLQGTIANDLPPNSTTFPWTVGNYEGGTVAPGTGYAIKITDQVNSVSDTSDDSFTISGQPTIRIISPNGGETWPLNKIRIITWNIFDVTSTLNITLWKDGEEIGPIAEDISPTTTSFSWTVGNYEGGTVAPATGYTIKIKEKGTTVSDTSDSSFTIFDNP